MAGSSVGIAREQAHMESTTPKSRGQGAQTVVLNKVYCRMNHSSWGPVSVSTVQWAEL